MIYKANLQREVLEEGNPIEDLFRNGGGKPTHPIYGIFLIASKDTTASWEPGTGFFISQNGLFATARHVLTDKFGNLLDSLFGIQVLRNEGKAFARNIVNVKLHDKADVAIGFLEPSPEQLVHQFISNTAFMIISSAPTKGDKIATFAIPKPSRNDLSNGKIEVLLAPRIFWGEIEEHHPTGRDSVLLPGNCYQTSIDIQGGCSGGPVFFGDGKVFGINSSAQDTEPPPISYVSSITDILDLTVNDVYLGSKTNFRSEVSVGELAERGYVLLDKAT